MKTFFVLTCLLIAVRLQAQTPLHYQQWWLASGIIDINKSADDYAICNRGQLKYMALSLKLQMSPSAMPGGPGAVIEQMIAGWLANTAQADDYAAANLGQLKNVAYPFYQRLLQAGLIGSMPDWLLPGSDENDPFQVINLGQLKNAFNVNIQQLLIAHGGYGTITVPPVTNGPSTDSDNDGILNTDEIRFSTTAGIAVNTPNTASNSQILLVDDASRFIGLFNFGNSSLSQGVSLDPENNVQLTH